MHRPDPSAPFTSQIELSPVTQVRRAGGWVKWCAAAGLAVCGGPAKVSETVSLMLEHLSIEQIAAAEAAALAEPVDDLVGVKRRRLPSL